MKRFAVVAVVAILGLPALAAPGQTSWVPLAEDSRSGGVRVAGQTGGPGEFQFVVEIPGVQLEAVEEEGLTFSRVSIPGAHRIGEPGAPQLPAFRRLVEIPAGAEVTVDAVVLESETVSLAEAGMPARVYPVQLPRPKCDCPEAEAWHFSFSNKAYEGEVRHELIDLEGPFWMRDHRVVKVTLAPVAYDAGSGTLEVVTRAEVTVRFMGGDPRATSERKQRLSSRSFDAFLHPSTLNLNLSADAKAAHWAYPDDAPIEFLIITAPALAAELAPFVEWKTQCGFNVTVVTTDTTGTTTSSIKSYIEGLYNGPNPPVYILMVGDSNTGGGAGDLVPTFITSNAPGGSDLAYVKMDGDRYPDMMIARWPVDDTTELINMRDKILAYEKREDGNDAWLHRGLFMGDYDYAGRGMQTHQTVIGAFAPDGNDVEEYWRFFQNQGNAQTIINELNTGRAWAIYSGHSGPTGWGGPPSLSSSDMPNFTNTGMYPLSHGHSCSSNEWANHADVFGEVAVTQPSKGFVSYWGGSNSTYWDGDDWLERAFFDGFFEDDIIAEPNDPDDVLPELRGQFSNVAACYTGLTYVDLMGGDGPNINYYWEIYNLDGDPTLDPFTRQPVAMTVGAPAAVPPAALDDFTVSVSDAARGPLPGALVGVTQDGVLLGAGFTGPTGDAVFHIDAPTPGTPLHVQVTAHNHLPTEASTVVAAGSDGIVILDASVYRCDGSVGIQVFDDDLDGEPSVTVQLTNDTLKASTQVVLSPDGGGVVSFSGSALLGSDLVVGHDDTLTVIYTDMDTGTSRQGTPKVDSAITDCHGPVVIAGPEVLEVGVDSVVVAWTTDEPGDSVAMVSGGHMASDSALKAQHELEITGLQACQYYEVEVWSTTDAMANGGLPSAPASFVTQQGSVALDDDVESGAGGWTVDTPQDPDGNPANNWSIVSTSSASPTHSWFSADENSIKDDRLTIGPLALGGGTAILSFSHSFDLETGFDGGVLEVSTDGSTFEDVLEAGCSFITGGYNEADISTGYSSPIMGRPAWSSSSGGWNQVQVDLSALSGSTVWLRFRLACDSSVSDVGWWVDDIHLGTTAACSDPSLFSDGFESGDCEGWTEEGYAR